MVLVCHRATNMVGVSLLILVLIASGTYAKSGCASFGHSCYGGIGKRADLDNANEEIAQKSVQDLDNSNYGFIGERNQPINANLRPLRYNRLSPEQYHQIDTYIREWIINHLRREEELDQN